MSEGNVNNNSPFSYEAKIDSILIILPKNALDASDEAIIDDFINEYWECAQKVLNAVNPPDAGTIEVASKGREIINAASILQTPAAKLIILKLSEAVIKSANAEGYVQERGNARKLKNPNLPSTIPTDDQGLDISGFTNALIIIVITILIGLILSVVFMNK